MAEPANRNVTYEDLYYLPDTVTGQIIDGDLIVTPRPSRQHANVVALLGGE